MKLALIGATGLVGREMIKVLEERKFPMDELIPVASERSIGTEIYFCGKVFRVVSMEDALAKKPDIVLLSAGSDVSLNCAPKFAGVGSFVIDNSSTWRMDPTKKLIVPEINGNQLEADDRIIANPNCSTIQMVLALAPLHEAFKIKRVVVSTYQSITGTGKGAVDQLNDEKQNGHSDRMVYPHPIDMNVLPHVDVFLDNDYTKEEMKLVNETKKILSDNTIQVTATCVRLPVEGGHSESVNIEFENDYDIEKIKHLLTEAPGIILQDNPEKNEYPMPLTAHGKDEVFVGRIRRDDTQANTLNMWIVSDNLRKGAATNTIQIAEYVHEHLLVC
ncbi:MAG: aspartate-semialdehyde dehydrogenase [Cytophagales bacterium]|nr:aspartate-semialdehyde dehydrogenase [Cytophagales bacterium]